ncbi:MAG: hypothetical protein KUG69_09095 [Marinosulfonomonas sp.]|nr:hypothetical protein [Marinosulfonomonas sp.]
MTSTEQILHFSLGPVQGFIADARRTRDLWAGSFLLSWLSGHAMAALVDEAERIGRDPSGVVIFPDVLPDAMFRAIRGHIEEFPYIGSLPNRFKADATGINNPGAMCRNAVLRAWANVESEVYSQFIEPVANDTTRKIWARQCATFWDISWVQGAPEIDGEGKPLDGVWLDQRKNWHTHFSGQAEPGDLCHQMGNLQEISGFSRLGEKSKQTEFWDRLTALRNVSPLDVRAGERLCAITLVKRFFPLIAENVIGWEPGGQAVDVVHWPSVSYIAALPWLKEADGLRNKDQSAYWRDAQNNLAVNTMGEAASKLFGLPGNGFFKLDGHLFHKDGIRAWPEKELSGQTPVECEAARERLLIGLADVQREIGGAPSEFYAVLIMDGDSIGARIGEVPEQIKTGLANFTDQVRQHFDPSGRDGNKSLGVLLYAGGDDVLALTPVDTAIDAAQSLRQKYSTAFVDAGAQAGSFTMSGAIVYAQYKVPLQAVLKKAHHYLDAIAKDRNGRDSLAIAVMKPGGITFDWVSCWDGDPVSELCSVARDRSSFSGSLFHNLRSRYAALFQTEEYTDREIEPAFVKDGHLMAAIVRAEYLRQGNVRRESDSDVDKSVASLMAIGQPLKRKANAIQKEQQFSFDGLLLASFLSGELMGNRLKGASGEQ